MNLDAIVWLIAGIGLGLGLSLMLLLVYSGLERTRLRGRLRQHRPATVPTGSAPGITAAAILKSGEPTPPKPPPYKPTPPEPAPHQPAPVTPKTPSEPIASPPTATEAVEVELGAVTGTGAAAQAKDELGAEPDGARENGNEAKAPVETPQDRDSGTSAAVAPTPPPDEQPTTPAPPVGAPRKPQSVEEIFAEAFASDPYVKPDQHGPVIDKP